MPLCDHVREVIARLTFFSLRVHFKDSMQWRSVADIARIEDSFYLGKVLTVTRCENGYRSIQE